MTVERVDAEVSCDKCGRGRRILVSRLTDVRKKLRSEGWDFSTRLDLCNVCRPDTAAPATPK